MNDVKEKIYNASVDVINSEGFELIDYFVRGGGSSNKVIQFVIDGDNGVTIKDCVRISRRISDIIDPISDEIGLDRFRLEVSSAGLDRPLTTERDFKKNINRDVTVEYHSDEKTKTVHGVVAQADSEGVLLALKEGELRIEYSTIKRAKIKLKW